MRHAAVLSLLVGVTLAPLSALAQNRPPTAPAGSAPAAAAEAEGTLVEVSFPGEIQLRYTALTDIALPTTPGRTDQLPSLGQNGYFEHWFRLSPQLAIGDRFKLITQFDIARLVLPDAFTQDVSLSRDARDTELPRGLLDFRWAYIDWRLPFGTLRLGQQGFSSGLGILANDGTVTPLFGDYRQGDIVERVAFATRPAGRDTDLVVAAAGDLVYRDRTTDLMNGDIALQGILSVFYQDHRCTTDCEQKRVGGYVGWRDVGFNAGGFLRVAIADLYARWNWATPDHAARVFAGIELAGIFGITDVAQTQYVPRHDVVQFGAAGELGIEREGRYRITLEGGYASGDSNPVDGDQRRFTFNPSHRVGLIMFPELLAWQSARSAAIAGDPSLLGRPSHGAFLLPTSGGIAGAMYLYPNARVNLTSWLDLRGALVIGVSSTDMVDPVSVQLRGAATNYLGGDPTRRDLGMELDLGLNARFQLTRGVTLTGGFQGGVMFAGHAFDDAAGRGLGRIGLVTARAGLSF